ncbi:MAG: hypothetical protein SAK29_31540 [Scytonema sp. PMC 1069.18]|nr:hypothetical protein [Scytonema sp. PMC 1069.18]MEC4881194.1 hypothetical protein [Scytonema sp. PMC 1070.18]
MAYVHEIKFFISRESGKLMLALYDNPPIFCHEFWIKNIDASEMGLSCIPDGCQLEQKYKVEQLGIKPFHASKPEFDFIDKCAEIAWQRAIQAAIQNLLPPV